MASACSFLTTWSLEFQQVGQSVGSEPFQGILRSQRRILFVGRLFLEFALLPFGDRGIALLQQIECSLEDLDPSLVHLRGQLADARQFRLQDELGFEGPEA